MYSTLLSRFLFTILFIAFSYKGNAWISASVTTSLYYTRSTDERFHPTVQVLWRVEPPSLHFVRNSKKEIVATLRGQVTFTDNKGIVLLDTFTINTVPQKDVSGLANISVGGQQMYVLERATGGTVYMRFQLMDLNDTSSQYVYIDSTKYETETEKPFFGSIRLHGGTDSLRAIEVLPGNFVGNERRMLHYSADLYNVGATTVDISRFPLVITTQLSRRAADAFMPDFTQTDTIEVGKPVRAFGTMPIGKLVSGNYYIHVTAADKHGFTIASRQLFFQRLNQKPDKEEKKVTTMKQIMSDTAMEQVTVVNMDKTFLNKYTMAQLRAILKMLLPVADPMQTNTINGFLKKPEEMYIKYFIYNYFEAQKPGDAAGAWKAYSEKVTTVNKKFNANGNAGYETDRGFIWLRYGSPTDIITVTGEAGAKPYEIWQYNQLTQFGNRKELTNSLFLFYRQSQNMTDYQLLHSTVPGETVNPGWRNYLYSGNRAANNGFSLNTRAEQYFENR